MDTLKVLKAQEQAEVCWKSFKERTLTKKTARENLLLNSDFNDLLQNLVGEGSERTRKVAIDFVIKCIHSKIISPVAFLALIQQKLPQNNSSKCISIPIIERVSRIVLDIEKETKIDFSFRLASNDLRIIPFLIEHLLSGSKLDISLGLVNFLLGDPDLILTSSVFDDPHYKMSRCRILSYLVNNVHDEDCAELLMTYLIWNSGRSCIHELEYLTGLITFFSRLKVIKIVHLELFEVYLEVVCNVFLKYGCFSEALGSICYLPETIISDTSAFQIGSLLLLSKSLTSKTTFDVLQLLSKRKNLSSFSKICCAKLMLNLCMSNELCELMKTIYSNPDNRFNILGEHLSTAFTDFGVLNGLESKGLRPKSKEHEDYYDFIDLAKNFQNFANVDLKKIVAKGYFEMIFTLLVSKWNIFDRAAVIKCFLKLLGNIENEDPEAKMLRYSWVVDFFETNFTFELYLNYLPLISESVTSSDNVLFAFVQQKISQFISLKDNFAVQLPTILSLYILFDSSQSRQSRLNFLASTTLSFLHNMASKNLSKVDTRAAYLAFKLLGLLCEIAVIDPRDIWTRYVEKLIDMPEMFNNFKIRGAIFSISSSLRVIPDGPEGEINEIKFKGIKLLLEYLSLELEEFALDQICESLTKFNVESLRKVEISLLKPESLEGEEVKEVPVDELLSKSNLFNPSLLYEISKRFENGPSSFYANLWTFLIDNEVENMSRTKFLGSNEAAFSSKSEVKAKAVMNPSFFNGLVFERFSTSDFSNTENVIKCLKTQLMPLVPSISTLLWYIRPQLPEYILEATANLFDMIDDQRIKKQLCDYEFLLSNLKSGTTPQALSTLLIIISSILKSAFKNQIISENVLFNNWIEILTKSLGEIPEFKLVAVNEEFLAAFALSCNVLSGCSIEIDKALTSALEALILSNIKVRDGVAVYCAIEAMSKLSIENIHKLLSDTKVSSKRKLIAVLACNRLNLPVKNLTLPDILDDISQIILTLTYPEQHYKPNIADPLEFKGLTLYVQSMLRREELCNKSQQRAFDSGSVPAALKYDAIFAYLLANDLDFLNMKLKNERNINISGLEASSKDPKCLALLQFVTRSATSNMNDTSSVGLERFDRLSWLRFVGLLNNDFKFSVLTNCKLLPRINWGIIGLDKFRFVLKHVLSITPITNVPFINPSLLTSFLQNVCKFVKSETLDGNLIYRIVEVLFNNSDEESIQILGELFDYYIKDGNDCLLEILLVESVKYQSNNLKFINSSIFSGLNSTRTAKHSIALSKFFDHFGLRHSSIVLVDIKNGKAVFSELQSIIQTDSDDRNLKLDIFSIKVQELRGKERIKATIDVIDLMFIHQQSEANFSLLSELLSNILKDIDFIILESKKDLGDPEIKNKIRSRSSILPKDICDRFETYFTSLEFDKESF